MLTRRVLYRVRAAQRSLGLLQQCNISSSCSPSMPPVRAHAASAAVSRSRAMYATSRINGVSANTIWNRSFSSEASKKDSEAGATTSPKAEASSKLPLPTEGSSTAPTDAEVKQAAEPSSDSSSTTPPTKSPEVTASPQTSASTSAEAKSGEGEPLHPDHPPYSESDREDEELQRSYAGFWPRFHVFKDMLFMEPTQREAALKRIIRTTSKVYGASGVYAVPIKIHMDLENPLLKKYGFGPEEFLQGAEVAFKALVAAVDPKATSDEDAAELLKAVAAPGVSKYFADLREQVREQQKQNEEDEKGDVEAKLVTPVEGQSGASSSSGGRKKVGKKAVAYATSQDIRLRAFFIEGVKTQIVPRKHNAEELPSDSQASGTSFFASLFSKPSPAGAEATAPGEGTGGLGAMLDSAINSPHDVLKGYLPGCVVARVRVQFVYEKASWGPSELAVVAWDFTGCLSSQMDLDWKIVYADPLFL